MSDLKATVLVDNIGNENLKGEWGLSVYIEYDGKKILLDTGASDLFLENAQKIGISIKNTDFAVLSHAHYDHSSGMKVFFENDDRAKFYISDTCGENCYFKKWIFSRYIGIPKGVLEKYSNRFIFSKGDLDISNGVRLIAHKSKGLDKIGKSERMYRKESGKWIPDDFSHEQSLVFKTEKGLVIFNSCCHGGVDNIIKEVQDSYPGEKVYAIIGGFHLYNKSEETVYALAEKIKETGIRQIYTGHCTGKKSYDILKRELGNMVNQLRVGLVMEF